MIHSMNLRSSKRLFFLFTVVLVFSTSLCVGQQPSIQILKKKCSYDKRYNGEKIILHYQNDSLVRISSNEYWLHDFIKLEDSIKFLLIEKLLKYENDTALCCMNVVTRSFNGIEGCGGTPKDVIRYTIQVDALYIINRLCWPSSMDFYSCTPVLYDSKLKRSINDQPKKIRIVFAAYKKWFDECKANGKISEYFPFNDGRYVWYGGRKGVVPKD